MPVNPPRMPPWAGTAPVVVAGTGGIAGTRAEMAGRTGLMVSFCTATGETCFTGAMTAGTGVVVRVTVVPAGGVRTIMEAGTTGVFATGFS